jgi:alpha-galactosidase
MKPYSSIFDHLILLLLIPRLAVGYNNGLARTPQMGWNTWNRFACDIDEDLILESARVVARRFKVYGYECTRLSS